MLIETPLIQRTILRRQPDAFDGGGADRADAGGGLGSWLSGRWRLKGCGGG
jgi:hypothetical protein